MEYRFPDPLLICIVLGDDSYSVCDQERRVETNTELTDKVGAIALQRLFEFRGARLGDGSEIGTEDFLGHANAFVSFRYRYHGLTGYAFQGQR
jgi:hypothetical protein